MKLTPKFLILALVAFIAFLLLTAGYAIRHYRLKAKAATELIGTLHSELRQTTNKLGQTTSTVTVMQAEKEALLSMNAGKDKLLFALQRVLQETKKPEAVTVFEATTEGKASGLTDSTLYVATADTAKAKPVYYGSIKQPDIEARIKASADSMHLVSYTVYTAFEHVEQLEKKHWYSKPVLVTSITPVNKNTKVTGATSWRKPQKNKVLTTFRDIGIGIGIGGLAAAAIFL